MFEHEFKQNMTSLLSGLSEPRVVVAVSTGVDSMVLLELLQRYFPSLELVVVHINHHLRPKSRDEAQFIHDYCLKNDLPLVVSDWLERQTSGMEQAARDYRYGVLHQVALENQAQVILTAHHADDLAETILMRLTRGGTASSLQGIAPRRLVGEDLWLIRPLLNFAKKDLSDYALENQVPYFEEESHRSLVPTRNRYRHEIIPLLKKENPQFLERMKMVSEQLADEQAALAILSAPLLAELTYDQNNHYYSANLTLLLQQSLSLQAVLFQQIIQEMLIDQGAIFSTALLKQDLNFLRNSQKPQGQMQLPKGWLLKKQYDIFILTRLAEERLTLVEQTLEKTTFQLFSNQWRVVSENEKIGLFMSNQIELERGDQAIYLDIEANSLPLTIRHRQPGDEIRLRKNGHSKKVRRLFIDQKIPHNFRQKAWIVLNNDKELIWIVNYQESQLSIEPETDKIQYILIYRQMT